MTKQSRIKTRTKDIGRVGEWENNTKAVHLFPAICRNIQTSERETHHPSNKCLGRTHHSNEGRQQFYKLDMFFMWFTCYVIWSVIVRYDIFNAITANISKELKVNVLFFFSSSLMPLADAILPKSSCLVHNIVLACWAFRLCSAV